MAENLSCSERQVIILILRTHSYFDHQRIPMMKNLPAQVIVVAEKIETGNRCKVARYMLPLAAVRKN
ncbi:MAG: hypothetical protein HY465_01365 [Deltaproteobacteria bacterium]|nr:hypothetical protein [Deltaproteobacteria bacterium]